MNQSKSETKVDSCCPSGSEPALKSDYIPKGTIENIDGLPIYHIGQGEKAIIFAYDLYGFDSGRTKQICDELAAEGYFVVLPDFFRDDGWKSNDMEGFFGMFRLMSRFRRNNSWEKGSEDFNTFLCGNLPSERVNKRIYPFLEKKGVKKIGMLGTCWGSYYVYKASAEGKISAGANFHPSLRKRKETPEELARAQKCPQMMLLGSNDSEDLKEGSEVEKILQEKFGKAAVFKTFGEMKHGWVVRGDLSKANVSRDYRIAMDMAIDFFKKTL